MHVSCCFRTLPYSRVRAICYSIYLFVSHFIIFFLSGLLCKRHLNKESVLKDIRFLILPYFTYGLFLIAFNMLCSQMFDAEIIWHKIKALSIGLDAGIGPIWFLLALFICKQMFMIISLVKKYNMYLYYLIVFLSLFPIFFISSFHINLPFFLIPHCVDYLFLSLEMSQSL